MGATHFIANYNFVASTDNENINPSQQPSATNTPSRLTNTRS